MNTLLANLLIDIILRLLKSKITRWPSRVARMGEIRIAHKILVGKPEVTKPVGRPRRRYECNIRMDLRRIGWGGVNWMLLAQNVG
jgi:hypothetical protein